MRSHYWQIAQWKSWLVSRTWNYSYGSRSYLYIEIIQFAPPEGIRNTQRTVINCYFKDTSKTDALQRALPLTPNYCRLRCRCLKLQLIGGRSGYLLFSEIRFCLGASGTHVLVRRRRQVRVCNQLIYGLNILELHPELSSWSNFLWQQDHSRCYPMHIDCKFACQSVNPTCFTVIYK